MKTAAEPNTRSGTDRLLRLPDVLARVPVSRSTWWQGVRSGRYPAAVKIGPNMTAWRASEIDRLIGGQ